MDESMMKDRKQLIENDLKEVSQETMQKLRVKMKQFELLSKLQQGEIFYSNILDDVFVDIVNEILGAITMDSLISKERRVDALIREWAYENRSYE